MRVALAWILAALGAGVAAVAGDAPASPAWKALKVGGGGNNLKLVFDPVDADRLYLAIDVAGVVRSTDGGESWNNSSNGLHGLANGNYPCGDIAVDPNNPEILYASWGREFQAWSGIAKSVDRGRNWTMISQEVCGYGEGSHHRKTGDTGILVDPRDSRHLYAADNKHDAGAGGLWESVDGGLAWKPTGLKTRKLATVRFHPGDPSRLYAGALNHTRNPGGFFASADGGATWIERGLAGRNVVNFRFDPADPKTIYAITGLDGFWRSDDDGHTWRELNAGLPLARDGARGQFYEYFYRALAVDPFRPGHVVVAADVVKAFYESFDGGRTWKRMEVEARAPKGWMLSGTHMGWHTGNINFHPLRKDVLFLNDFFGTWKSDDGGRVWRINPFGQESSCMTALLPDRERPGRLYLGIWDHFMLIQQLHPDGTETTAREKGFFRTVPPNKHLSGIVQLDPADRMFAVTNSTHPFASADRGQTWTPATDGLPEKPDYRLGAPLAGKGLTVWLPVNGDATDGGGVYRSDDGGVSWRRPANQGLEAVKVCGPYDPRQNVMARSPDAGTLYLASAGKLWISTDGAERWTAPPLPDAVNTVAADDAGTVLLGTEKQGLWFRAAGETTWRPAGAAQGKVRSIAAQGDRWAYHSVITHPDKRLEYHLSGSADRGATWRELLDASLPVWNLQGIAFDPFDPSRLYVNTYWSGSWSTVW